MNALQRFRAPRLTIACALALSTAHAAQPAPATPAHAAQPAPPPPSATPAPASGPALSQLGSRVAADLAAVAKDAVVFAGPLKSDESAPRAAELVAKLSALVAGALNTAGAHAASRPDPVVLASAHALAGSAKTLVYLQPEIVRGQLRLTADVYRVTPNVWDRARQPAPAPSGHSFASARVDAEVRSYLALVPLVVSHIDRVPVEDRDIVAVGCGDIDEDGALEIVTLGRKRVTVGRVRANRFVPFKVATWRDLSPIAGAPLREPVGNIAIVATRGNTAPFVDIGLSDRAHGNRFDVDFRAVASIPGVPYATRTSDLCVTFQGSTLSAKTAKCAESDPPLEAELESPFDTAALGSLVAANGTVQELVALRDPRTGELRVRSQDQTVTLAHAGASVALADLDQDGTLEILSTLDVLPGKSGAVDDALVITSWLPPNAPREISRTPVPGGVRAVSACPPEGQGISPIVLATLGELWVIR